MEFISSKTINIVGTDDVFSCVKHVGNDVQYYYSHEWAHICVVYWDFIMLSYVNIPRV
jgi:hypothetical protein